MNLLRALISLATLLLASPSTAADLVLPISFDTRGMPMIQLDLGGKTYALALDTGSAEGLHLDRDTVNQIEGAHFTGEARRSIDLAGTVRENERFIIDELSVNGRTFRNIQGVEFSPWGVSVREDSELPKSQVIGLGLFTGERILIDYAAEELIVFDASTDIDPGGDEGWVEIPFHWPDDGLVLDARIAGEKHAMVLDSAATHSLVIAGRIADTRAAVPCETVYPSLNQTGCRLIPVETEFGGVRQTVHAFALEKDLGRFESTGVLGGDFLKNNAVLIDLVNERMHVRPTPKPAVAKDTREHFESQRTDGSTIHWTLDLPATDEKVGLLVLAQGSGCEPAVSNRNLKVAQSIFENLAALMVEQYGVTQNNVSKAEDNSDCPRAFHEHQTVSQRVSDYRQIIESLRGVPWWNGQLILFGGSEGGLAMAMLAPEVQADAAILVSTGGGVPFGQMVRQSIPEEGWPTVDATFEKARQNPNSSELWAGHSLRFWADMIDRRVADDMLRADTRFLLIQGGRDVSGLPDVARSVSDMFAEARRCNLTYWELPGLDHGMVDANGNTRMTDILSQAHFWLNANIAADSSANCTSS